MVPWKEEAVVAQVKGPSFNEGWRQPRFLVLSKQPSPFL